MLLYRILSALLRYPEADLIAALPELREALQPWPEAASVLQILLDELACDDLITLQENYVATFDRNPKHSLHLFEHVHGESRDRGQAMVDLLEEYRQHGFEPQVAELPDHVPLFLEFLSLINAEQAQRLLDEAVHVLAAIGQRLSHQDSPYTAVFLVLRTLSTVEPRSMTEPPVRDMDEALETFGPGADGVEPLLAPRPGGAQPVQFYPRASAS